MRNGVIVMTALIPTKGHQFLIDFASNYMNSLNGLLYVIVCSRSHEPIPGRDRAWAFDEHFCYNHEKAFGTNVKIIHHVGDSDPQNPEDDPDFWGYWRDIVRKYVPAKDGDILFASEKYGIELAKSLNAEFVPCDISRQVLSVRGTDVRMNLANNFSQIMPEFQPHLRTIVTIFGAESTGKTTIAKTFGQNNPHAYFVPEWAREYLLTVGHLIDDHKMETIAMGQQALQDNVWNELYDRQAIIQDTDLLSTIGYYRIYKGEAPQRLIDAFKVRKSDLYIVMNSKIPFEADILRYGGGKRESTDQFWIDLLKEFDCNYYVVKEKDPMKQVLEIGHAIDKHNENKFSAIWEFQRT